MLAPVCLPAAKVAGVALFSIFIAILNLYLAPLLPSSAVLPSLSLRFPPTITGSSQRNKVVKVGDADIVWPVCEREPIGVYIFVTVLAGRRLNGTAGGFLCREHMVLFLCPPFSLYKYCKLIARFIEFNKQEHNYNCEHIGSWV